MLQPSDVRLFIQDRPEYNRLLGEEEFSPEQIDQAMKLTVAWFNEILPLSSFPVEDFPFTHLLLMGTVWHLLFSGGLKRSRNRLVYNTDGTTIDDEAHADIELGLSQSLRAEFKDTAQKIKVHENIKRGYSHVPSEYLYSGYYRSFWRRR
jgi:hypothetical protein